MKKTNGLTKAHAVVVASLVAALAMGGAAGCELIVDFDRTKIDAGPPTDGSVVGDGTVDSAGDTNVPDTAAQDSPVETGTDGGADVKTDTGMDAATEAAAEAGPEAGMDAAMEAEAATAASLAITATNNGAFGSQDVGTSSADVVFTVTNSGGTASAAVTIGTSTAAGFILVAGQDNCTGNTVAANNGTCTFKVHFTPLSDGAKSGNATCTGAPNRALTGAGKGLSVAPTPKDFGTVTGPATGAIQTFTVTNNASVTSGTLTFTPGGADLAQFTIVDTNCGGTTVASMMTCTFTGNFTPAAGQTGAKTATVIVNAAAGVGGSTTATLTGTAM